MENSVGPSSPCFTITNYHKFDGSKKQELVPYNLEVKSLTTRCQQEYTPSKWRDFFLPLLASGGSRHSFASDCIPPTSSSIEKTSQGLPGEQGHPSHLCVS